MISPTSVDKFPHMLTFSLFLNSSLLNFTTCIYKENVSMSHFACFRCKGKSVVLGTAGVAFIHH